VANRIRQLEWAGDNWERDRHVLLGQGVAAIRPGLYVRRGEDQPDGSVKVIVDRVDIFLGVHPTAALSFVPLYKGALDGLIDYKGLGITVNTQTGAVRVVAAPPRRKNNFIIEAVLRTAEGESVSEKMRVQVHKSVSTAWLTPARLTVRRLRAAAHATKYRFTLRVQFDDDVIGDLTDNHGVTWASVPAGRVTPDGFLTLRTDAPADDPVGRDIQVTATLPAALGGMTTAPATVHVERAWKDEKPPPKVTFMDGAGLSKPVADVPNVLFIADGFLAAPALPSGATFETFTDLFLYKMRTSRTLRPYDLLLGSMNFWRLFLPADTLGVSVREEVSVILKDDGTFIATGLPPPLEPPKTDPWQIEHLIYVAGLPIPGEDRLSRTAAGLRTEWTDLLIRPSLPDGRLTIEDPTIVSDALIGQWMDLAKRSFIDERDAFPGVAMGEPPAASNNTRSLMMLHDNRGGELALAGLFDAVTPDITVPPLPGGHAFGDLWKRIDPAPPGPRPFRFDSTSLLIVLSSYPGGRPNNSHRAISFGTTIQRGGLPVKHVADARNAYTLVPRIPDKLDEEIPYVVGHELGHSFGLGDEYLEFEFKDPQFDNRQLDIFGNLQFETEVLDPVTGKLASERIKWRWPRVRKGAVVDGVIKKVGGIFEIPVRAGQGSQFAVNDKVLLRARKDRVVLGRLDAAGVLATAAVVVAPIAPDVVRITSTLPDAAITAFGAGSLLFELVPAPASVNAQIAYAEMIAKNVRNFIDGPPHEPIVVSPKCKKDPNTWRVNQVPGINTGLCVCCSPGIVGLYQGGHRYTCGVYRPALDCIMARRTSEITTFCHVCRYILVDFIDPVRHAEIDRDYDRVYPLK
jgi:hypothetical protein